MVKLYWDKPSKPAQKVSRAATKTRCTELSLNMLSLLFFNRLQFKHEGKGGFDERVSFLDKTTYTTPLNPSFSITMQRIKHSEKSSRCHVVNVIRIAAFVGLYAALSQMVAQRAQEPSPSLEPIPAAPSYTDPSAWTMCAAFDPTGTRWIWAKKRKWYDQRERREDVDVFYIHPTMYEEGAAWNVGLEDAAMNDLVDEWPVRHQSSIFTSTGRLYAPRYRQAHIRIFSLGDSLSYLAAEVAYSDIRAAFEHYLTHWNHGRPIVLAGHSQGAYHGRTLLQEFFEVARWPISSSQPTCQGWTCTSKNLKRIPLSKTPEETGCLCTWMTYAEGHRPGWLEAKLEAGQSAPLCVNPITWNKSEGWSPLERHLGAVLPNFRPTKPGTLQCKLTSDGVLEVTRPQMIGGKLLDRQDWHEGDFNLFWFNVEDNVRRRTQNWLSSHITAQPAELP